MAGDKFEPMLCAKIRDNKGENIKLQDMAKVSWPKLISKKIDGIRGWSPRDSGLYSRTMKLIPNRHVQSAFGGEEYLGIDGELIHGTPYEDDSGITVMQKAQSATSTRDGPPNVDLYAFDLYDGGKDPYYKRLEKMQELWGNRPYVEGQPNVIIVQQELVNNWDEAWEKFAEYVGENYEGAILKNPERHYVHGRPSLTLDYQVKLKPWVDGEGVIVDFEELHSNQNEQMKDERGYSKRSSHKENQVPMGILGAFVCEHPDWPERFKVGTGIGLTFALRKEIWENRPKYLGQTITFKYNSMRSYRKPSLPSWRAFRWDV